MVRDDVKIANRLNTGENGAKMFKYGFLPSTMHRQERPYVHRILYTYAERILLMHKLKNRYTHARTSLRKHEFRLRTQEQVCVCKPNSTHARMNAEGCSSIFFKFSQPKLNLNIFLLLLECHLFI